MYAWRLASFGLIVAGMTTGPAFAASVTLHGSEFDVVYNSTTLGLFNTPVLVGNVLFFTPSAFTDQSLNGQGAVWTTSNATGIQLIAHTGFMFGDLAVSAQGDYVMTGAQSRVSVTGTFGATDPSRPLTQTSAPITLSGPPLTIQDGIAHNWSGGSSITNATPTDVPGHNPWLGSAQTIDIALSNTLYAFTAPGIGAQHALIQEKFAGLQLNIDPVPVPLPAALPLLLAGVGGLAGFMRGRRRIDA